MTLVANQPRSAWWLAKACCGPLNPVWLLQGHASARRLAQMNGPNRQPGAFCGGRSRRPRADHRGRARTPWKRRRPGALRRLPGQRGNAHAGAGPSCETISSAGLNLEQIIDTLAQGHGRWAERWCACKPATSASTAPCPSSWPPWPNATHPGASSPG